MPDDARHPSADRLDSWKEIAGYLAREVRTVQRWERVEGLPVHRHLHGERGSVYAYKSEIDAWRAARHPTEGTDDVGAARHRSPAVWLGALAATLALAVTGWWVWQAAPASTSTAPAGETALSVSDAPRLLDEVTREGGQVATIRVGHGGHRLAVTPDGARLYVTNAASVSVVDTASRRVIRTIDAVDPSALAISADGSRVYVGQSTADVLTIDARTMSVGRIVTHGPVRALALTRDGRTLYIAAEYAGLLAAATDSGTVRRVSSFPCPVRLALAPDGGRLYVGYQCGGPGGRSGHDSIDILDSHTRASIGVIRDLPNVGGDLAVSPDGEQIWAEGGNACTSDEYDHAGCPAVPGSVVNVVRASDRSLVRSLTVGVAGEFFLPVCFSPEGSRTVIGRASTTVFSAASFAPVESAPLPLHGHVAFSPDGRTAYLPIGADDVIVAARIRRTPAPPSGLNSRWSGDGTPNDINGPAHGVVEGDVRYGPGRAGQAFHFGGHGVLRSNGANLRTAAHAFTIAAWVKVLPPAAAHAPRAAAAMTIAEHMTGTTGAPRGWRLQRGADGRLSACFAGRAACPADGSRAVTGSTALAAGRWYHVALSWNGRAAILYVDGRTDGQAEFADFTEDRERAMRFGLDLRGAAPLSGMLDEIEIYERPLSAEEIAARFAAYLR